VSCVARKKRSVLRGNRDGDPVIRCASYRLRCLSHPQAREQLMKIGLEPNYQPGEAFGAYLRNEVAQISRLMKAIAFVRK
jgi:hypothetical protein